MLQLSGSLINQPVLSLRTGGTIAITTDAIINPNNLKIEGFYCQDSSGNGRQVVLYQDIRDVLPQGIVVNDLDALSPPDELVRLQDIMAMNFQLIGKSVITENKQRLGKVNDYATEVTTMYVQKLYVSQSLLKNLGSGSLGVERTQIIEITNRKIIIQEPLRPTKAAMPAAIAN